LPSIFTMIKIELFKLFKRPFSRIGLAVIVVLAMAIGGLFYFSLLVFQFSHSSTSLPDMPEELLLQEIEYLEEELENNPEYRGALEEEIKVYRRRLELGYEKARPLELQENIERMEEQLSDPRLPEREKERLESELEIARLELKGDQKELQEALIQREIRELEQELEKNLSPSRKTQVENHLKQLKLDLAVQEQSTTDGQNAYNIMLMIINSVAGFFFPLFVTIMAAEQISGEYAGGSIKLSLIRPVSRNKLFSGKFVALMLASIITLLVIALAGFLLGGALSTFDGFHDQMVVGAYFDSAAQMMNYEEARLISVGYAALYALGAMVVAAAAVASFALLFSSLFSSSVLPVLCAMGSIFVGNILRVIPRISEVFKYLPFAHLNPVSHFADSLPMFSGFSPAFSILILLLYTILFLAAGMYIFRRRDILA
jgi:ABC-2 type transport system permease protein